MRGDVARDSDGRVIYSPRKSSLENSRRRASVRVAVGGMFANRYIFISQLLAQRVGPRVYIRRYVTPRGRNSDFPSKQNDLRARSSATARSFVFTAPLHLIWRPRSPLMDPRISRFSSAVGCADRSVMRVRIFLGFLVERDRRDMNYIAKSSSALPFLKRNVGSLKSENSDATINTICNEYFNAILKLYNKSRYIYIYVFFLLIIIWIIN